ncbi:DUF881 domain-containing protein [Fusibacter sp. JL216-2]|uniref:DUF881 domain-containing protein n=1 Tax=Fusibacter sp. JL216-2 TaxID=3071453 RepID=UPI003D34DA11
MKKPQTIALVFLLAILLSIQVRAAQDAEKYVSLNEIQTYTQELERESAELNQLVERVRLMTLQISEYENSKAESGGIEEAMINQIEKIKAFSGLKGLEGQGVIVIINDGERELNEFEDPNNVLVHNMDVQNLVDDLRYAGAEAISINDQRFVFGKTEIQCTGPTIRINDEVFAQPFIIKAIGDKHHLESAINAPGSFGQVLRQYGVFLEVYTSVNIEIPAYTGTTRPVYMKATEDGEES